MLTPFDDPFSRGGGRRSSNNRGGGGGAPSNPFEMMNSHMAAMDQMMGSMMGGGMGGMMGGGGHSRGHRGGGGMGSMMDDMMGGDMRSMMGGMGGGGGGGGSYSCSSCCYSSSSSGAGGQPHVVQYSSSSHGMQRPGEEMVSETHRNYRDSTGTEKLGVSRRIGERGRSVVAERAANGMEERRDNLLNIEDGSAFDREWRGNSSATQIGNARTQMRTQQPSAIGMSMGGGHHPALGFGGSIAPSQPQRPQITTAERDAAREAGRAHEQQRERMIAEARANREQPRQPQQAIGYSGAAPSRGSRGGGGGGRGPSDDEAYASRLAQQEARRAGMYR